MLKLDSLREVFLDELRDLLDAEHQLVAALPRLADKATAPELKAALHFHRTESAEQIARLEHVFESLGTAPERRPCKGMRGLLAEGRRFVLARGDSDAIDAALISAMQKVEHYEIASYGTLRTHALVLGLAEQAGLLQKCLDEEALADQNLSAIAETWVNDQALVPAEGSMP
jgi:ferritin-like metal-binding protein YciE